MNYPTGFCEDFRPRGDKHVTLDGLLANLIRSGKGNRGDGLAKHLWMLGAVPCKGRVFSLFSQDAAVRTPIFGPLHLFVAAFCAVDGMTLVVALLRAVHISVLVVDDCDCIEVNFARICVCCRM